MKNACLFVLIASILLVESRQARAQQKDNSRLLTIGITGGLIYGGSLYGLSQYWYKSYPKSKFHFFDDNNEWEQMDKSGHCFASYYEGYYGLKMLSWAGLPRNQAIWYGGTWGLLMQTPIEIMDGFSSGWGFSWGDMLANTMGTALLISQEYAFGGQRFQPKFSYFPTEYARGNPNLFGDDIFQNIIKDYNGQNYWLSTPISAWAPNAYVPTWFTISIGFGAKGMWRGTAEDQANDPKYASYTRYKQVLLSFDVNLVNIDAKSEVGNTILGVLSWIKVPSPTIEYSKYRGFKGHWLYF